VTILKQIEAVSYWIFSETGTGQVSVYNNAVKLEFLSSNPSTFKPGLEYIGYVS
jgi:hypothetical protein